MTTAQEHDTPPEEAGAEAPPSDDPVADSELRAETEAAVSEGADGANGNGNGATNGEIEDFIRAGNEDLWVSARGEFLEKDVTGYVPTPESDELRVELSLFAGPLDLLLHLLDRHTFDIFDIPIAEITAEYLKVLDDMAHLNLDIAGEFLVMASRLAHIKSKMLLPPEPGEDDEEEDGIDPRLELMRRLLEYQRFKEVAEAMAELPQLGRDTFARARHKPDVDTANPDDPNGVGLQEFDVIDLIGIFEEVLKRSKTKIVHEVIAERLSVGARINELVDFARTREHFTFREAAEQFGTMEKGNVIVTFLSILEMARLLLLRVHQPDDGEQIYITPIQENLSEEQGDALSDFDSMEEMAAQAAAKAAARDAADDDGAAEAAPEVDDVSDAEPLAVESDLSAEPVENVIDEAAPLEVSPASEPESDIS